jgi:hypothetical protein
LIQDEESKDIKIGRTSDINRRIREIRRGSNRSYEILYSFRNCGHLEKQLHQLLHKYHIKYEWFKEECIEEALNILGSYGLDDKGLSQTWGKVCDFDRWLKSSDMKLYEDISDFIFISLCFGYKWTKEDIESTFKMTKVDALVLILEIDSRNKIHILSRFIEMMIDEEKLEAGVFELSDLQNLKLNIGPIVYANNSLRMTENIRKTLNQINIELSIRTSDKVCPSYQVSLF